MVVLEFFLQQDSSERLSPSGGAGGFFGSKIPQSPCLVQVTLRDIILYECMKCPYNMTGTNLKQ